MSTLKHQLQKITGKDVVTLSGQSLTSAYNKIKEARAAMEKQNLTIGDYCNYWDLPLHESLRLINQPPKHGTA